MYGFAQVFVIFFVTVFTFYSLADFFHQLHLSLAVNLDCFVSKLHGFQQVLFRNFLHFTFHHHDVFIGSGNHDVHVSTFQCFECRVDDELTVDTCYTYFRNRTSERNVRNSQCGRSSQTSQCIRHIYAICRIKYDIYVNFSMVIVWEQRAQCAVYQTASEDFVI